jgi:mono/diheme cytochrome c family protein
LALSPQTGCAQCHTRGTFVDGLSLTQPFILHNVGTITAASGKRLGATLTGIDTPTLRGVWETPPYLHHGQAATLTEVLTTFNPSGQHGNTALLSPQQIQQLVAYLLQLENEPMADLDGDTDVDADDSAAFWPCISGAGVSAEPGCEDRDLDGDGDVDQSDFAILQRCQAGPGEPVDPLCKP